MEVGYSWLVCYEDGVDLILTCYLAAAISRRRKCPPASLPVMVNGFGPPIRAASCGPSISDPCAPSHATLPSMQSKYAMRLCGVALGWCNTRVSRPTQVDTLSLLRRLSPPQGLWTKLQRKEKKKKRAMQRYAEHIFVDVPLSSQRLPARPLLPRSPTCRGPARPARGSSPPRESPTQCAGASLSGPPHRQRSRRTAAGAPALRARTTFG
jgi:hypothetical protein